jgi:hypothetical protein
MINTFDALFYTFIAVIPGFIIDSIIRVNFPVKKRDATTSLFRFIFLSALNYIIWMQPLYRLYIEYQKNKIFTYEMIRTGIFSIIVTPIAIGFILCWLGKNIYIQRVLGFFGFSIANSAPTAWDSKFSNLLEDSYLIVTLIDNSRVYGQFSKGSFAASNELSDDLYLAKTFVIDEKGKWIENRQFQEIIISSGQIKLIEIYEMEEK